MDSLIDRVGRLEAGLNRLLGGVAVIVVLANAALVVAVAVLR